MFFSWDTISLGNLWIQLCRKYNISWKIVQKCTNFLLLWLQKLWRKTSPKCKISEKYSFKIFYTNFYARLNEICISSSALISTLHHLFNVRAKHKSLFNVFLTVIYLVEFVYMAQNRNKIEKFKNWFFERAVNL